MKRRSVGPLQVRQLNPFAKRLRACAFGRDSRQSFLWRPKAEQLLTGHEDTYHA
jgi:hypothetical protein